MSSERWCHLIVNLFAAFGSSQSAVSSTDYNFEGKPWESSGIYDYVKILLFTSCIKWILFSVSCIVFVHYAFIRDSVSVQVYILRSDCLFVSCRLLRFMGFMMNVYESESSHIIHFVGCCLIVFFCGVVLLRYDISVQLSYFLYHQHFTIWLDVCLNSLPLPSYRSLWTQYLRIESFPHLQIEDRLPACYSIVTF